MAKQQRNKSRYHNKEQAFWGGRGGGDSSDSSESANESELTPGAEKGAFARCKLAETACKRKKRWRKGGGEGAPKKGPSPSVNVPNPRVNAKRDDAKIIDQNPGVCNKNRR